MPVRLKDGGFDRMINATNGGIYKEKLCYIPSVGHRPSYEEVFELFLMDKLIGRRVRLFILGEDDFTVLENTMPDFWLAPEDPMALIEKLAKNPVKKAPLLALNLVVPVADGRTYLQNVARIGDPARYRLLQSALAEDGSREDIIQQELNRLGETEFEASIDGLTAYVGPLYDPEEGNVHEVYRLVMSIDTLLAKQWRPKPSPTGQNIPSSRMPDRVLTGQMQLGAKTWPQIAQLNRFNQVDAMTWRIFNVFESVKPSSRPRKYA